MQDRILDGGTSILNAPEMRVGRNDPCPCGSGQEFKKCHGAVIAVQSLSKEGMRHLHRVLRRWAVGTIYGHDMKPGVPCHFRGEGCCTIYCVPTARSPIRSGPIAWGLLAWMREFAGRTGAPFFYEQKGERFGIGPPAFQPEMPARLERGEKLW
jgi:hypothetical protein